MSGLNVVKYDASLQKLASSFHSGNDYLDRFLREQISLDDNFGKTYILLPQDKQTIIGYYNLGVGYVEQDCDGHYSKMGGAVHINGFALDEKYHGLVQGDTSEGVRIYLSDILLNDCLERIEEIRREYVGFTFVTLSSTREGYSLYKRNGFEDLEEDMSFSVEESDVECKPMYLAIEIE